MSGTVQRGPDGSYTWRADDAEAFLPVTITTGQITFTVDAAFPEQPVQVTIRDAESARDASVFADPSAVNDLVNALDTTGIPAPDLSDGLVRLTTVTAVDTLHLGDLDDGVLSLDVAYARALLGDPDMGWYLALASSVPGRLVDEIESADHGGPLVTRLAEVIGTVAIGVLPDDEMDGLLGALRVRTDRSDVLWDALFGLDTDLGVLAADLGGISPVITQVADLRALPPRLLRFDGPEEPEVEINENVDGSYEVSAELRDGVDADSAVVDGIFAVAADPETGDLVAFAPATASGDRITARIVGVDGDARFAFVGSEADPAELRLDHFGVAMTRVDRHFRHAWTRLRNAGAVLAGLGITDSDDGIAAATAGAETERQAASDAVGTVRVLLRQFARRYRGESETRLIAARLVAVEKLDDRVREPLRTDGPGGPTLAELHMIGFG
ncbi:hypothetical protein [Gordonia alkanivorans]|uniref:Uncharacterized protein n=1 Tax=Gordonia alkanivorans NBRC 16433 TaxID=1027371 RepID=F9W297_9ACTN|nr:hypothetical protein [Gordonia alkanivorans]GAA14986.1 hypothetical protein GOALK_120_00430 [Gordonia alkanivorans NBRC 16433]